MGTDLETNWSYMVFFLIISSCSWSHFIFHTFFNTCVFSPASVAAYDLSREFTTPCYALRFQVSSYIWLLTCTCLPSLSLSRQFTSSPSFLPCFFQVCFCQLTIKSHETRQLHYRFTGMGQTSHASHPKRLRK